MRRIRDYTPWRHSTRDFHSLEGWKPRGTFSVITWFRNRCPIASQNRKISFCVRSLSTSRTCTFAKECTASITTTAQYISNFCILLSSYYNKPAYSTPNELWLESRISILKCPAGACISIPLDPAARSTPASLTSNILLGIKQSQIYLLLKCGY